MTRPQETRIFYGWWIVAAAFLNLFFVVGIIFYGFPVFYPALIESLHFTRSQVTQGFLLGMLIVGLPTGLLAGAFIDRIGARSVILAGVGFTGASLGRNYFAWSLSSDSYNIERLDFARDHGKRIVDVQHEHAAHHVDHADRHIVPGAGEVAPVAGCAGRVISGAEQPRLGADVLERFLLVPDVIPGGHHVDAPIEQLVADLARDAEAGRGVLDVGNHQVGVMMLDDAAQAVTDEIAARPADDVADEQQAHALQLT